MQYFEIVLYSVNIEDCQPKKYLESLHLSLVQIIIAWNGFTDLGKGIKKCED